MVRVNLWFQDDMQVFVSWLAYKDEHLEGFDINHWLSLKEFSFRDMFQIKCSEFSFVLAVGFNGKKDDRYKGFVEFNPNKCKGEIFDNFMAMLYSSIYKAEVIRYDLAIDIPIPRYLVKLVKDQRNYQFISNRGSDTEYLGVRSHSGFVKLYDKQKESDLKYDLTRLEVTCGLDGINFPVVKILPLQENLNFDKLGVTDKVLIQLLKQSDNPIMYLKQLKYEKRKKIEPYLVEETVQLDKAAYFEIQQQVNKYNL